MVIEHQLKESNLFVPDWPIDVLVLGTFNPTGGQNVDYFYSRSRNRFWPAIFECFEIEKCKEISLDQKLDLMRKHHFGCMDIIKSIKINEKEFAPKIMGEEYRDANVFSGVRGKKLVREYNWEVIKNVISKNNTKTIIHTWGKRCGPLEFRNHLTDFIDWCQAHRIKFIPNCPSPSAHGGKSTKELAEFYRKYL